MKAALLLLSSIVGIGGSVAAQQSSLCFTNGDPNNYFTANTWTMNMQVTNPNGITIRSIEMHRFASPSQNDDVLRFYLRNGNILTAFNDVLHANRWTLHDTEYHTNMGTGENYFDIEDLYLPPGTYGMCLNRTDSTSHGYVGAAISRSNADMTIVGVASATGDFGGTTGVDTIAACFNYDAGPDTGLTMSSTSTSGPLLTNSLSANPADLNGDNGGQNTSLLTYAYATNVNLSAPATASQLLFDHWIVNGAARPLFQRNISVTTDEQISATAVYDVARVVTMQATCDGQPVNTTIASSPADVDNQAAVAAGGSLDYRRLSEVTFVAEPFLNDCAFSQWRVDGVVVPTSGTSLTTTIAEDTTIVAEYGALASCYDGDIGAGLGLGDDQLAVGNALGFDFPLPGGGTTDSIDISSNGFVWLVSGSSTDSAPVPAVNALWQEPQRICALWEDLEMPGSNSDVHFQASSGRAVVTWKNVKMKNRPEVFTVQLTMFTSGRVQFAHIGEFPSWFAKVGVLAGNAAINQPGLVSIHSTPSWSNSYDAGWFWDVLPGQLASRTFTCAPNAVGWDGFDISDTCTLAVAQSYGTGCPTAADESFWQYNNGTNVAGQSYRLVPNSIGGYDVDVSATSLFDSALGVLTTIGDESMQTINLPFSFAYPSNPSGTTAIDVCDNGYFFMQSDPANAINWFADSVQFFNEGARMAPMWIDLDPSAPSSDGVYVNALADRVVITWNDCVRYGTLSLLTVQCVLFADGSVTWSYGDPNNVQFNSALIGWSPGSGTPSVTGLDLPNAVPFATAGVAVAPMELQTLSLPLLGETVTLTASSVPATPTLGLNVIGFQSANLPLDFLGAEGCTLLNTAEVIDTVLLPGSVVDIPFTLPMAAELAGVSLFVQLASLAPGFNDFGFVTSNGVQLTLGDS